MIDQKGLDTMKKMASKINSIKIIHSMVNSFISNSKSASDTINAVYVFGSVLNEKKFKQNSDIDLAFLLDKSLYNEDMLSLSADSYLIAMEIGLTLNRKTDVIILNSSSLETAFQVITTGVVVYEKQPDYLTEYEIAIKGMYYDFKPFIETLRSKSLSRITQ